MIVREVRSASLNAKEHCGRSEAAGSVPRSRQALGSCQRICESFTGKLRDEFLNGGMFYSLKEVQILTDGWRVEYDTERPYSTLAPIGTGTAATCPNNREFPRITKCGFFISAIRFISLRIIRPR